MIDEIRAWLRACPLIDQSDRFGVGFLTPGPVAYSIQESPVDPILTRYLDGSTLRARSFVVASREPYGADVSTNLRASDFWEAFLGWIEEQNRKRSFPAMQPGQVPRAVEVTNTHYLVDAEASTAQYQIQIQLTYYQKGER